MNVASMWLLMHFRHKVNTFFYKPHSFFLFFFVKYEIYPQNLKIS